MMIKNALSASIIQGNVWFYDAKRWETGFQAALGYNYVYTGMPYFVIIPVRFHVFFSLHSLKGAYGCILK